MTGAGGNRVASGGVVVCAGSRSRRRLPWTSERRETMQENKAERAFDKYRDDLNPDFQAGQQRGGDRYETVLASEIKAIYDRYPDWSDDLLRSVPVMVAGSRLEEG